MNNNELYHFGIKGMKWGIRRYQNYNGTFTKAGLKRYNDAMDTYEKRKADYKTSKQQGMKGDDLRYKKVKVKEARKKDLKNRRILSDQELQNKINRLKMEKQFKELSEDDLKPGRTAVKKFMGSVGGKVVTSAAIGALAYAGKHYISKRDNVNWEELANYMFANPNKKK